MRDDYFKYTGRLFKHTVQAIGNLSIFLPYFFSVSRLLATFFAPWKNVTTIEERKGTAIHQLVVSIGDQFASRLIGSFVRFSLLVTFIFVSIVCVILIPVALLGILAVSPISYIFYTIEPSPEEKRNALYNSFMKRHLYDQKNQQHVMEWFEVYYSNIRKKPWWSLEQLMSRPPLGRDLTSGFTYRLDQFSHELTLQKPHHKHLIGRDKQIEIIERILSKTGKANVLLNGETGVGKRAIVEALAKRIFEGRSSSQLAYKRVLEIDMESILSQTSDHIQREQILSELFEEAEKAKNVIIYIQDLDRYVFPDKDHVDVSKPIAQYASSQNLQFIATTTPYNYHKYIFRNKTITALFDKVDVTELTPDQAIRVLLEIAPDMEARRGVNITYEALESAVHMSDSYMPSEPLPEKAIALLDEACAYARRSRDGNAVTGHIINTVVEYKTHVPTELSDNLKKKLINLEATLRKRVFFQDEALHSLSAALRESFLSLTSRRRPLASFLLLGPTGVGKTETAKAVTEAFFGSEENLIRFDMSNYQSKADIPKLIGSQTTDEPGILTEAVQERKYGTLLLDELEKADPDLLNIFLTMIDEGYFTDGFGRRVNCTSLIIIATSNAGADYIYKAVEQGTYESRSRDLIDYLIKQSVFSPEFLNRFDGVVAYKPLYKESMYEIASRMLENLRINAKHEHNLTVTFSDAFVRKLVNDIYDPQMGARNMRRVIRDNVEDPIAQLVLKGEADGASLTF